MGNDFVNALRLDLELANATSHSDQIINQTENQVNELQNQFYGHVQQTQVNTPQNILPNFNINQNQPQDTNQNPTAPDPNHTISFVELVLRTTSDICQACEETGCRIM